MRVNLYKTILTAAMLLTIFFTLNGVYDKFYGFEFSNITFHFIGLIIFYRLFYLKLDKFLFYWFLGFSFYLVIVSFAFHSGAVVNNIAFLSLTFVFIYLLPLLNVRFRINYAVHRNILLLVSCVIVLYLVTNIRVYASGGFLLNKDNYNSVISGINTVGYLLYLGFSISWMLAAITRKKRYFISAIFYFCCCMFLIPVLTVYFGVFVYIFTIFFLNRAKFSKRVILIALFCSLVLVASILIKTFDTWRVYLSLRDLLYINSFQLIKENPWFGYGVNNWGFISMEMQNPHNFILYLLLSFGIIGFFLYAVFLLFLVRQSVRNIKKSHGSVYYKHLHAQLLSHFLIMSSFVAMPGNYQAASLFLSIYFSILLNGLIHVQLNEVLVTKL